MKAGNGSDLFGRTFLCECGKTHHIEPREVVYSRKALDELPSVCARAAGGRRVTVIMDIRTREVAGARSCRLLADDGRRVTEIVVPDGPDGRSPVCDDVTKERLSTQLDTPDLIVAVGSGVISDLGKWLAFEGNLPFICVATAASMNGYASANVAPTIKDVKTLVRARPPVAVVANATVIENAPHRLTASGLGDILAKSVSSADWRLNHLLFGDYYCERSVGLIADIEPLYLDHSETIKARAPQAIEALFRGLLLTGAAMTMAETSSPSSGGEHMVSHTLDMMSTLDGAEHDLHGRQVGVGTILASELYRRVLAIESPEFAEPGPSVDRAFWGRLADAVQEHYADKDERMRVARETISRGNAWDDVIRRNLAPMLRSPEKVRHCLKQAGAACRAADIKCDKERLLTAFLHGHEIRPRFTILDLARLVGVMPAAAEEIVEAWADT